MALGAFLMIWGGEASGLFKAGEALLAVAVGVLLPGPEYHKVLPKKKKPLRRRRRPAKRTRSAPPLSSALETSVSSAHTVPMVEVRVDNGAAALPDHGAVQQDSQSRV
jgi:hypothetical protein